MLVEREIIEHVAEIDVGRFAERHHARETDRARFRPIHDRRAERAGLRNQRERTGTRAALTERRVELGARAHQPQAIRPEHAHAETMCFREQRFFQLPAGRLFVRLGEAGRMDDGAARTALAALVDDRRNRRRGRRDDRKVDRIGDLR